MQQRIDGRTALVTGGGRNIGRAISHALAANGAHVFVGYAHDKAAAESTVVSIEESGGSAAVAELDLIDPDSCRALIEGFSSTGTPIDILVLNAAVRPRQGLLEITAEDWDHVHSTNLRGPFFLAQATIEHMARQGWGRIIAIGGIDAYKGTLQRAHVVASKLGIVGAVRAMANEVARFGVTVNVIVPGLIDTERYENVSPDIEHIRLEACRRIPMGRLGTVEEVSAVCTFLASDSASYITGQELFVTGGMHPLVRQPSREWTL